jgi:hypothetical protein
MRSELTASMGAYARALRRERLPAALDERIAGSIERWAAPERKRRAQSVFETRLFAIAAVLATVLIGGAYALLVAAPERGAPRVAAGDIASRALVAYPEVVPLQEVVLRVPTTLSGAAAVPAVATTTDELRFWVDVRIASDGSMRVVRVVPVDPSRR